MPTNGQWFSPGTPASSTKTGCHDIAEILLKVALKHQKNQKTKSNHDSEVETTDMYTGQNIQRFQVILFSFINLYTHKGNG